MTKGKIEAKVEELLMRLDLAEQKLLELGWARMNSGEYVQLAPADTGENATEKENRDGSRAEVLGNTGRGNVNGDMAVPDIHDVRVQVEVAGAQPGAAAFEERKVQFSVDLSNYLSMCDLAGKHCDANAFNAGWLAHESRTDSQVAALRQENERLKKELEAR